MSNLRVPIVFVVCNCHRAPAQTLQSTDWWVGSSFTASYETSMERPHRVSAGRWYSGVWCEKSTMSWCAETKWSGMSMMC